MDSKRRVELSGPLRPALLHCIFALVAVAASGTGASAQTTAYHLHAETASGALLQLSSSGPDAATSTLQSANLRNLSGERLVKEFVTTAGAIGAGGVASGKTFTFQLWMRKTSAIGTMVPRARVRLNSCVLGKALGRLATLYTMSTATSKLDDAARAILDWLGPNARVITNEAVTRSS